MRKIQTLICLSGLLAAPLQAADIERPLGLEAAASYRQAARYPEWSRALRPGEGDPIRAQREPTRQILPGRGDSGRRLAVWASGIAFEPGETVDLHASIERAAPRNVLDALKRDAALTVKAALVDEQGRSLGELDYRDDGKGADASSGDGVYSARYTLPRDAAPPLGRAYSVMVRVSARAEDGETFAGVGGFQYSHPGAVLNGRYDHALRDGDLVLSAGVDVAVAGRYHLAAVLGDAAGQAAVEAQAAAELQPGRQTLDLRFYGLAFHDRALSGPLRVHSITLTSALGMPNALGPVLQDVAVIPARPLEAYTARPFARAELIEAAQRLEADVRR